MAEEPVTAGLRQNTLMAPADKLAIEPPAAGAGVWGVNMDVTFADGGSYTTVALADGNASIYIGDRSE